MKTEEYDKLVDTTMASLKDFQRATVDHIDRLFRDGVNRVLVSDEVGLGKTHVAKGVIAKTVKLRMVDEEDINDGIFKAVYICSNASIADQNLKKLNIFEDEKTIKNMAESRLSMQHFYIYRQAANLGEHKIQLIPMTPNTSFNVSQGSGTYYERALIFAVLSRSGLFDEAQTAALRQIMRNNTGGFDSSFEGYDTDINKLDGYIPDMTRRIKAKFEGDYSQLYSIIKQACTDGGKREGRSDIIRGLRIMFAAISLEELQADLVIMDEFQRFKTLIDDSSSYEKSKYSESSMLAYTFFNNPETRILMLSATPYKMFSTLDEVQESKDDSHYEEFKTVMRFLNTEDEQEKFVRVWGDYSAALISVSDDLCEKKNEAEAAMYRHVCRTERESTEGSAQLVRADINPMKISEEDVTSYIDVGRLAEAAGSRVSVDYVKSSPYLMSFMQEDYAFKKAVAKHISDKKVVKALKASTLWLDADTISSYKRVPTNNARLSSLMDRVFSNKAHRLLWVPPSIPYYPLSGDFKNAAGFTKTLIFSSWRMVPRMLSTLISYEAERRCHRDRNYFERKSAYFSYSKSNGRNLLSLLYPCEFLRNIYDPVDCLNRGLSLAEIRSELKQKLKKHLARQSEGKTDKSWYYLAPMMLDDDKYVLEWLKSNEKRGRQFDELRRKYESGISGAMPDDMYDVLADMAIASPGVCAYRTYRSYCREDNKDLPCLATELAEELIGKLNTVDAAAVISSRRGTKWKKLLSYCVEGNLQAVLDEYFHVCEDSSEKGSMEASKLEQVHRSIVGSLNLNSAVYDIDGYSPSSDERIKLSMRTHFAVSFSKGSKRSDTDRDTDRRRSVRDAFNSPFRPFVLASTSIGQEGLDFHKYCRRVVHWNLPANPIDLEQREGRITRYKCLAVRQTLARRYGTEKYKSPDIWSTIFNRAFEARKRINENCSDLVPYWNVLSGDNTVEIERIVPIYPFSRDAEDYHRIISIVDHYRMTLGQPRQERLIEVFARKNIGNIKKYFINLCPFLKE